jgi:hypothetical protein
MTALPRWRRQQGVAEGSALDVRSGEQVRGRVVEFGSNRGLAGLLAELVPELLGVSMEPVPQNTGFLPHRSGKLQAF